MWIRQTLMHLYKQLSILYIQYTKIDFQLNNTYFALHLHYSVCMTESRPTEIRVDVSRPEIQRRMDNRDEARASEARVLKTTTA